MKLEELKLEELTVEEKKGINGGEDGDTMYLIGWHVGYNFRAMGWLIDKIF